MGDETDHPDQTGPDQTGPDQTQPDQNHEPETDEPDAVERLNDDLGDIDDRSDEMQQRLDELGMSEAQRLAARRAIEGLGVRPDRVLLDGKWDFVGGGITRRIVRGDARCLSISAASILAKVTRDRLMLGESEHHPWWFFDSNKGYPCPRHKAVLRGMGPSSIHRRTWVFMDHLPWTGIPRIVRPDPQGTLFDEE